MNIPFWSRRSRKDNRAAALDFAGASYSLGTVSPHFKDYQSYLRAYKLPWVRACVQVIAYNCANIDLNLVDPTADDATAPAVDNSPFLDLMAHPNPFQTGFQLKELLWTDLELTGNGFMSLESMDAAGRPAELYRLSPDKVTVIPNPKTKVDSYKYSVNGQSKSYAPEEIIHFKYPNPLDELYGMGVIEAGEGRFDSEMAMLEHERQFWRNGAKITGVLHTDQQVDDTAFARMRDNLRRFFTGSGYSTLLLENGLEYQSVSDGPAKLGMLDMAHASRDMILAMFGVPPTKVGILENANYKAQNADEFFWTETIDPKLTRMEQDLTPLAQRFHPGTTLVPKFARLNFVDDMPTSQVAEAIARSGSQTVNEIRDYQGKDPLPEGGDVILIPQRMTMYDPATGVLGQAPPLTSAPPAGTPLDDEGNFVSAPPGTAPGAPRSSSAAKPPVPGVTPPGAPEVDPATGEPAKAAHLKLIHTSPDRPATAGLVKQHAERAVKNSLATHAPQLAAFFAGQEARVKAKLATFKKQKATLMVTSVFDDDDENARLAEALSGLHEDGMEKGYAVANQVGIDVAFNRADPLLERFAGQLAKRVTGINQTTKDGLDEQITEGLRRGYSVTQIADGVLDEKYQGVAGVFSQAKGYRSEMIARSETLYAYNGAAMIAYRNSGLVEEVEILDGIHDSMCSDANGRIMPLDEATEFVGNDHPNGTRTAVPIVSKARPGLDTKALKARLKLATTLLDQAVS